jgi:drug/metabolite transporter (DMT)-like permease
MPPPKRLWIILAFAALYVIWGSTYIAILFAIQSMPPLLMAGARFVSAGLIMYGAARMTGAPRPAPNTWRSAVVIGGCLLLCGNGGVTISERWVPTGLAALLVATVPIYIALLGWISGTAPRPTALVWLGLVGGFAGVAMLVAPAFASGGPGSSIPATASGHLGLGMGILLAGSLLWSIGSLYSRKVAHAQSLFVGAGQQMICGGGLLALAGTLMGEYRGFHFGQVSSLSLWAFVYLVLIGALVGYTAYFYLLRHCDPAKVATYAYVNPLVAILLGTAFAGEHLTWRTMFAAGLIIGSVAVVITAEQLRRKRPEPISEAIASADCVR